jgi:hypothetical protein
MYPGSDGSDGRKLTRLEYSFAGTLAGVAVVAIGIYVRQKEEFE